MIENKQQRPILIASFSAVFAPARRGGPAHRGGAPPPPLYHKSPLTKHRLAPFLFNTKKTNRIIIPMRAPLKTKDKQFSIQYKFGFRSDASLLLIPFANRHHKVKVRPVRQMRHIRHAVRPVMTERLQLLLVFVGTHDHDVRAHVKVFRFRAGAGQVGHPRAYIHVGNAHRFDVRLFTSEALLDPFHKDGIKAARFVVRVPRNPRQAAPIIRTFSQDSVRTVRRGRPVENGRAAGDELRPGAQRVSNFLRVSLRLTGHIHLRESRRRSEKTQQYNSQPKRDVVSVLSPHGTFPLDSYHATISWRCAPKFVMPHSKMSPTAMYRFLPMPTPGGVPVARMSPGTIRI